MQMIGTEAEQGTNTWQPGWKPLVSKTLYHIAAAVSPITHATLVVGTDPEGGIWQAILDAPDATIHTDWTRIDGQFRA